MKPGWTSSYRDFPDVGGRPNLHTEEMDLRMKLGKIVHGIIIV